MTTVFIIINQHQQWLGKQQQWVEHDDVVHCFRTPHYDIALNQLIESNARDTEMRLSLLECPLDSRGNPLIEDARPAKKRAVQFDDEDTPAPEADADADADADDMTPIADEHANHGA